MAKQKFLVTGDQHVSIDKKMLDIKRQLYLKNGSPLDPNLVIQALQKIDEGIFSPKFSTTKRQLIPNTSCLRLIPEASNLLLGRSDGELFMDDQLKFTDNFHEVVNTLTVRGQKHPAIRVSAYELIDEAIAVKIFNSFSAESGILEKTWLTQKQIMDICFIHYKHLNIGGYGNLFLTKKYENFNARADNLYVVKAMYEPGKFVVKVVLELSKLDFSIKNFYDDYLHPGDCHVRVFVPQQFKPL